MAVGTEGVHERGVVASRRPVSGAAPVKWSEGSLAVQDCPADVDCALDALERPCSRRMRRLGRIGDLTPEGAAVPSPLVETQANRRFGARGCRCPEPCR